MSDDPNQPPVGAIFLSEFFDPRLSEVVQQAEERLRAAKGAIPLPPPTLGGPWAAYNDVAYDTWRNLPEVRAANKAFNKACDKLKRAKHINQNERQNLLVRDEWSTWGREGSPVGPWRLLPADAWRYIRLLDSHVINNVITVPGPPTRKFYSVVVARRADMRRGRPSLKDEDAPALAEMDRILKADPALSSRDHRRIAGQLIDDGWVDLTGATRESVVRRLVRSYRRPPKV